MIDGLKPYPAYKDSGVPWLGPLPEHWDLRPLRRWVQVNPKVLSEDACQDAVFSLTYDRPGPA